MRTGARWLRWIALALLAVLASGTAQASSRAPVEACVARLVPGADLAASMRGPAAFDCRKDQVSHGEGDFLVQLRFPPARSRADDPLILQMSSVWQRSARIHFRFADGVETETAFDSQSGSRFLTIGARWEVPVPHRAAALETVFIEVRGAANVRGVVNGPRILPRSQADAMSDGLVALYSGFAGLALALVVYNLALWNAMRHRFQLEYCRMVVALAAYTFTSSGLAELLFPALDSNVRLRLNYLLLAIFAVAALSFVRHFFEPKVFSPRLIRATGVVSSLCLAVAIAYAALYAWPVGWLDRAYTWAMLIMLGVLVPIVCNARAQGSRYLWLFLLAWSPPILVALVRIAHGFNLVGYSFMLDNGNMVAMALEALLSSLMITARLRELSLERDHAVAGEQVARRLAATDPLTGLLNRRAFLDLAIGRRSRYRLMLIDIDHFKKVNDRFGHDAGDEVLRAVADAIQQCRPPRSLAVRLGGEEFALLVPRSAFVACPAEAVLEAVRHHAMPQGARVTVSLGYADGTLATEEDWKRLYRVADAALYRAKSDGRDRACRATDFRAAA